MATINSRTNRHMSEQKLVDGLTKRAGIVTSVFIGGQAMSNAQLVAKLKQIMDAEDAVLSARASFQAAVHAERTMRDASTQFLSDLKQTLRAMFSGQPDVLADFGLPPRKKTVKSPETKVAAAVKAKATREARGIKGKKQREEFSGNVTGVVVTPVVAPEPSPAPAPATPAASHPAPTAPSAPEGQPTAGPTK